MNKIKYIAAVLIGIAAFGLQQVKADTFTYDLDSPNTAITPYPGPYGTVQVNLTSSNTATITFTYGSSGGFTYLGIDSGIAGVNVNATAGTWTIGGFTWTSASTVYPGGGFAAQPGLSDSGAANEDGFGSFNQTVDGFDGTDHAVTQLSFTLTRTSGTWASASSVLTGNANGFLVGAHIVVFASDNVVNGFQLATGYVANNNQVPDGGTTVMLLGAALGALGMARRFLRS
jgi:hypothetical protein